MDLLRMVEAARHVTRTPFWNDVTYLAQTAEQSVRDLRCKLWDVSATFDDVLGDKINGTDGRVIERVVERYLQLTGTDITDLRAGVTSPAVGLNKSTRQEHISGTREKQGKDGWEWYYARKHMADWQILALDGKIDEAYTGMVHFLGSNPDYNDIQRAHFRKRMATASDDPFFKVIRGIWRELYAAMPIHEDPELLVQLAATAASKRRGWDKKHGEALETELKLDGVDIGVFEYLTGRNLEKEKTRTTQPAPTPVVHQTTQSSRPARTQTSVNADDIGAAVDAAERGETVRQTPNQARGYTQPYVLRNVQCVGSDGLVFEQYAELRVQSDVVRRQNNAHQQFTPYQAILHFKTERDQFLPSMALSCNILVALYHAAVRREEDGTYTTLDAHAKQILDQYKDHGAGYGWHAQNTVVDWKGKQVIHYPKDEDFPEHGDTAQINQEYQRNSKPFDKKGFEHCTLEEACKKPNMLGFLQDFTGLQNPLELIPIAQYFGKTARVWVSSEKETRAAWLGCNDVDDDFSLDADSYLYDSCAARGVASISAP
ncbi:MAG: hypothetical protein Q7R76_05725 [Candidatus Woesearchaeota archaeon]|nr:hypothetical protein [Candidatus Woesearchaeota archaeon]